jgi:hypothetical protein
MLRKAKGTVAMTVFLRIVLGLVVLLLPLGHRCVAEDNGAIFYGLSTFPGLARINDDEHYFSQVALGWFLAYLSCAVVEKGTDRQEGRAHVQLAPVPKGLAITLQKRY